MNVLQRTILEVKLGDRVYKLECLPDSPLSEINQSLSMMNNYVLARIEEANKAKEEAESKVEHIG